MRTTLHRGRRIDWLFLSVTRAGTVGVRRSKRRRAPGSAGGARRIWEDTAVADGGAGRRKGSTTGGPGGRRPPSGDVYAIPTLRALPAGEQRGTASGRGGWLIYDTGGGHGRSSWGSIVRACACAKASFVRLQRRAQTRQCVKARPHQSPFCQFCGWHDGHPTPVSQSQQLAARPLWRHLTPSITPSAARPYSVDLAPPRRRVYSTLPSPTARVLATRQFLLSRFFPTKFLHHSTLHQPPLLTSVCATQSFLTPLSLNFRIPHLP